MKTILNRWDTKTTLLNVADLYMKSPQWRALSPRSRAIYGNGLNNLIEFWDDDIRKITRPMVIGFRDRMYGSPGKCREALATLNNIFQFAYDRGVVEANPAGHIKGLPPSKPIPRWPANEIQKFIDTAPDYLARTVKLALYTGQRRSDLIRMERDDILDGYIHVIQQKTGKELFIPIHPKLRPVLEDLQPCTHQYLIWNKYGQKWSADVLTGAVKKHALMINLKNHSIHGIRKATASTLAEIGATPHQIASITGQSLKEIERYTQGVEQKKMATAAMENWK